MDFGGSLPKRAQKQSNPNTAHNVFNPKRCEWHVLQVVAESESSSCKKKFFIIMTSFSQKSKQKKETM